MKSLGRGSSEWVKFLFVLAGISKKTRNCCPCRVLSRDSLTRNSGRDRLYYDNLWAGYTLRPLRLQDPPGGRISSAHTRRPSGLKQCSHRTQTPALFRKSHIERQEEWRSEVVDESIQPGKRFARVNARIEPLRTAARPQKQRRIALPNESESESETTFESRPAFSSRLGADFRDISPDSSDFSSRDSSVVRRRRNRVKRNNRSWRGSRRDSYQEERHGFNDNSLHVIKTLKGWGIRAAACLPSVLLKEASDLYEVHQDEIFTRDFKTFERAFRRQFIGELHHEDIMEELRARY